MFQQLHDASTHKPSILMVARWLRQIDWLFGVGLRVTPSHQLRAFASARALASNGCFTNTCFWPLAIACLWTQILAIMDGHDEGPKVTSPNLQLLSRTMT